MTVDYVTISLSLSLLLIPVFLILFSLSIHFFDFILSTIPSALPQGGGCNCSRANLAGALLGASYGFEYPTQASSVKNDENVILRASEECGDQVIVSGIPLEWMRKTDKISEILLLAIERVAFVE